MIEKEDRGVQEVRAVGRRGELLTAGEVGERLRLPLSTVYYLAKLGKLRGFRVGRSWRFPANAIGRLQAVNMPLVLVVDANKAVRSFVTKVLQARGCRVEEAGDVAKAVSLARRNHFDVLLVDPTARGEDDTDLLRELKGDYSPDQMVIITAVPDLVSGKELTDLGAVTLLPKPLAAELLVACVERIAGVPLAMTAETDDGAI